jgi:hypothetical protein
MDKLEIDLRAAERDLAKDENERLRRILARLRAALADASVPAEERLRRVAEVLAST